MNIDTLSIAQLKSLLEQIPGEIKRREKEEKAKALAALEAVAAEHGFKLNELLETGKKPAETTKVAVKYRHPANPDLAWTGRGRQPKWVVAFIKVGGTLEHLAVCRQGLLRPFSLGNPLI